MIRPHPRLFGNEPVAVHGEEGLRGVVDPAEQGERRDRVVVRLEGGRRLVVPTETLMPEAEGTYRLTLTAEAVRKLEQAGEGAEGQIVMPLAEERLEVGRRAVETGRVVVRKTVSQRDEVVDEPLMREQVDVHRVAVNQVVEGAAPQVRHEGDVTIVPLLEEVLVVQKRLLLREELHIRRERIEVHEPQRATLRREEANVERRESET